MAPLHLAGIVAMAATAAASAQERLADPDEIARPGVGASYVMAFDGSSAMAVTPDLALEALLARFRRLVDRLNDRRLQILSQALVAARTDRPPDADRDRIEAFTVAGERHVYVSGHRRTARPLEDALAKAQIAGLEVLQGQELLALSKTALELWGSWGSLGDGTGYSASRVPVVGAAADAVVATLVQKPQPCMLGQLLQCTKLLSGSDAGPAVARGVLAAMTVQWGADVPATDTLPGGMGFSLRRATVGVVGEPRTWQRLLECSRRMDALEVALAGKREPAAVQPRPGQRGPVLAMPVSEAIETIGRGATEGGAWTLLPEPARACVASLFTASEWTGSWLAAIHDGSGSQLLRIAPCTVAADGGASARGFVLEAAR
jgi:hypothetical protein